ncbi:hypothetical protein DPMN_111183 [Dreissena polymorpha]|uniref:Uncharacterized protein n=1 Tax=Dreissena polymorpha TaxID=45954 RepID=A0A9D4QPJ2_DREPO|nr:hypothetical protein DPMN_111183 [Dreissena polymorpha]
MWAGRPRINRIVIREVQYQFEAFFWWAWPMWAWRPRVDDRIVVREVQYQFEVNRCRNEEIIVKSNFGWTWPMWAGRPRVGNGAMHKVQYQFEDNCFQGSNSGQDGRKTEINTISPLKAKAWDNKSTA